MKNNLKKLVIVLFLLSLSACAGVVPPDIEACVKGTKGFAYCNTTLSNQKKAVSYAYVSQPGRVSMSLEDFGKLKKFVMAICEKSKKCQKQYSHNIDNFLNKTDEVN